MKKKLKMAVLSAVMILMMSACGKKDTSNLVYLKDFEASSYVTLGDYKNVEINLEDPVVTDEDVDQSVEYILQTRPVSTPVTGRAAELGDIANIDYEGKLDGVAFDGGTAAGYDLELGGGGFIDGFEDGVVGMEIGETRDLDLNFPDPYTRNPDLSGAAVVFTVTLNSLSTQEPAQLNDEFVEGLMIEGCSTVEEFQEYIRDSLMVSQMQQYEQDRQNALLEELEKMTDYKDMPEGMVSRMTDTLLANITAYAQIYGADVGQYVAGVYGGTAEEYEDTLREQANMMTQRYIMLAAIAKEEGITVSDTELEEQLDQEAADYGYESVEEYTKDMDKEAYREYLLVNKALEFLSEVNAGADEAE